MNKRLATGLGIAAFGILLGVLVWLMPPLTSVDAAKLGNQARFNNGISVGRGGTELDVIHVGQGAFTTGAITVPATWVTATTRIFAARGTVSGTSGVGIGITRTAGTSFTLTSQTAGALTTQTSDTSQVSWITIDQPTPYPTATP